MTALKTRPNFKPGQKPDLIFYQNELGLAVYPALNLAYEVLSSEECSDECKNYALTVMWNALDEWREIDRQVGIGVESSG